MEQIPKVNEICELEEQVYTPKLFLQSFINNIFNELQYKDDNISIYRDNNKFVLEYDGDLYIKINGEFGINTNNGSLCLDSINDKIFWNSRASKELKDTEEAIEYRKKRLSINKKKDLKQIPIHHKEMLELKEKISKLEKRLNELENK